MTSYADPSQLTYGSFDDYTPDWAHNHNTVAFSRWMDSTQDLCLISPGVSDVAYMEIGLRGDYHTSWSPDGESLAFDAVSPTGSLQIFTTPLSGEPIHQLTVNGGVHPAWSPVDSVIAFTSWVLGNDDIWLISSLGGTPVQVTSHPGNDWHAAWSPDGSYLAFTSDRSGNYDIWIIKAEGDSLKQITTDPGWDDSPSWSPDGRKIAFESNRGGNFDIWTVSLDDRSFEPVTFHESADRSPDWSSDGTQLVFVSYRDVNDPDLWIIDYPVVINEHMNDSVHHPVGLYTNYPNPFTSSTTIRTDLHSASYVKLSIFDIHGRLVSVVFNHFMDAGVHDIVWNAKGMSAGTYVYRIDTNESTDIGRCILIR